MGGLVGWPCVTKARGNSGLVKALGSPRVRSWDPHSICVASWAVHFEAPNCLRFRALAKEVGADEGMGSPGEYFGGIGLGS